MIVEFLGTQPIFNPPQNTNANEARMFEPPPTARFPPWIKVTRSFIELI